MRRNRIARSDEQRPARWWINRLVADRFDRLRPRRLMADYEHLGENRARHCFAPDWGVEAPILRRLRAAINGTRRDQQTLALLALLRSCQVHHFWFQAVFGAELEDLLTAALREDWGPSCRRSSAPQLAPSTIAHSNHRTSDPFRTSQIQSGAWRPSNSL